MGKNKIKEVVMSSDRKRGKFKVFFIGSLIGGIIGSTTALLFAPKDGKKLRKDLAKKCHKLGDKSEELVCDAREKCEEIMDAMKDFATDTKRKIRRK